MIIYVKMDFGCDNSVELRKKRDRNLCELNLDTSGTDGVIGQPLLVVQSPKTPTLSRRLKAVSLDSEAGQNVRETEVSRDVSSVPNTPKKQPPQQQASGSDSAPRVTLLGSNLKRFASNTSISGSQTLKTLPEVMTLQDFSGARGAGGEAPVRIRAKGLLERRGSNASLTLELGGVTGGTLGLQETKHARSVSNLNLTSLSTNTATTVLSNILYLYW